MKTTHVRALFDACTEAASEEQPGALARRFDVLARVITEGIERYLSAAGIPGPNLPDLRQEVLIKVHAALRDGAALENPEAWLRTVCKRVAIDRFRSTQGRTYVTWSEEPIDDETSSSERELFAKGGAECAGLGERALDARRVERRCLEAVTVYAERAEGQPPRGHQVLAWFGVHVLEASTAQVLEAIARRTTGRRPRPARIKRARATLGQRTGMGRTSRRSPMTSPTARGSTCGG